MEREGERLTGQGESNEQHMGEKVPTTADLVPSSDWAVVSGP